ncbi:MAG: hypothetical protein IKW90_15050 [Lachnospiraceae bacterium]|nr:hypothetical protein [Lachnospiraceae bacterium]
MIGKPIPSGSSSGITISKSETVVGTYLGKTLYAKVYTATTLPNNDTLVVASGFDYYPVFIIGIAYNKQDRKITRTLPFAAGGTNDIRLDCQGDLRIITFTDWSTYDAEITLFYTKTA